jgi:hypothetical protein
MNVNNNHQRMHFLYIYYISQHSYMFRPIWVILTYILTYYLHTEHIEYKLMRNNKHIYSTTDYNNLILYFRENVSP